ncbi:hypothetical protein ABZV29_34435 [Streptomyces sp. NPDC005236]|uniref:hypothetical protein n=1 Tax=Streptomyces sp. NPDC005236 TaxID=3157028 RepID=UPI0033B31217
MTTAPQLRARPATPVPDDAYVVPERLTTAATGRGPRVGDTVWDLRPFVPRTTRKNALCHFSGFADDTAIRTAKEYLYSRFRRGIPASYLSVSTVKPMKITWAAQELARVRNAMHDLRELGITRLSAVTREDLAALLDQWKKGSLSTAASLVTTMKQLAAHRAFLHSDGLDVHPWPGRTAAAVVGKEPRPDENSTDRIPEEIMAPLLRAAVFYITIASRDIRAARAEIQALQEAGRLRPYSMGGAKEAAFTSFIAKRRAAGRGLPALPLEAVSRRPGAEVVGGVVQSPNITLIELMIGGYARIDHLVARAAAELGFEEGGLDTPMSPWPESGRPWRPRLDPTTVNRETEYLRTACWIVIAYLSGLRDDEVRLLGRECAFTETGDGPRIRYKLRGRVYKNRKISGDEAEWVVLDIVHQAVDVLLGLHDDPDHLFGYWGTDITGYQLFGSVPYRLGRFRDHANELFSTEAGLFIPNDTSGVEDYDTPDTLDSEIHQHGRGGEDPDGPLGLTEEGPDPAGVPWSFDTRQFRRTLAWHIAHQPFGVVAGARQYQHARIVMFKGYAGTSESGFAEEVAANDAVARLDYLEDIYRDWNNGGASSGGAAERISAEFERIRRELGDLPGVVASPARLRTMLRHLTKTLHPGVLNDCFYQAATAVCRKRAKALGRPVPLHNMCLNCPNARRSAVHLPRLTTARDQALTVLDLPKKEREALPRLQVIALTDHAAELDELIQSITTDDTKEGARSA